MRDSECTAFLQWALPRLSFRWAGFRKVRRQVCRRIRRRTVELGLDSFEAYRHRVESQPAELAILDSLCRITISRFYRDREIFDRLGREILPGLASATREAVVAVWSAGCASGEEPYSLAMVWRLNVAQHFPEIQLRILATDADAHLLERARAGAFTAGSLKELPEGWRQQVFSLRDQHFHLRAEIKNTVDLVRQDLRASMPAGPFDLVLCRNLAFTYFDEPLQRDVLARLSNRLKPGGILVIGAHESLPEGSANLEQFGRCCYRSR
ncbi:MAG: protein-glutamate O-methyltransferase CheR [bacterium]|nr:protein-glutamate O-methyltransferase CheR [bacterium]